jgi:hypothetical protein
MSFPTGQSRKNRYQPHRSTKQFRLPLDRGQGDWLGLSLYDSFIRYLPPVSCRRSLITLIHPRQHVRWNRQADLLLPP